MLDDPDGRIARACKEALQSISRRIQADVTAALGGTATTATIAQREADGLTVEKLQVMMKEARIKKAELDRTAIVVVVIQGHQGPMLRSSSPATGSRIECSHTQAVEIHKTWPLRLSEVISADIAEFVPAMPFDLWVTLHLPAPPFETGDST